MEKIILVGTTTQNNKLVNGQSMMFQLLVDNLNERGIETKIIDFGKSFDNSFRDKRVSGKFSFIKLFDNLFLTFRFLFVLISNPNSPIYINTSQSKVGFFRDYLFITIGNIFNRNMVGHQFGANYENFYNQQSPNFQRKIKSTLDKLNYLIVEGDYTKNQMSFLDNYNDKVISIPNGLPEKVKTSIDLVKEINQPVVILYLSNLIESKGFWDVLEAGNILKNEYEIDIRLVFAGKFLTDLNDQLFKTAEDAKKHFFRKIDDYGLKNSYEYYEGLYGKEKEKKFKESNFFVLPSYYGNEGMPVSVLEALAYGCIPIVTKYRLIPSMVNENNGFFVEAKNPRQIADSIVICCRNPNLYKNKSREGISHYMDNFTADKYISQILKLFK